MRRDDPKSSTEQRTVRLRAASTPEGYASSGKLRSESQVYGFVLGELLLRLRERHGLTQTELAARGGLTQSTLSRIERGLSRPAPFALRQLAAAFGLTAGSFHEFVQDAYQRTEHAARAAVRMKQGENWWNVALSVAGVEGLTGLIAFAVAATASERERPKCPDPLFSG